MKMLEGDKDCFIKRLNLLYKIQILLYRLYCKLLSMDDLIKSLQLAAVFPEESVRASLTGSRFPPLLCWKPTDLILLHDGWVSSFLLELPFDQRRCGSGNC